MALHRTHKELLATLDEDELHYWLAYHQLHNISPDRADYLTAIIAMTSCQVWTKDRLHIDQFLPKWDTEATRQSNKEALKQWAASLPKAKQYKA